MSFNTGFSGEYNESPYGFITHGIPRSYHRQPGSPDENTSSGGVGGGDHSPLNIPQGDLDFGLLSTQHEHIPQDQGIFSADPPSASYSSRGATVRHAGPLGTMPQPSMAVAHGFVPQYPLYQPLGPTSHYPTGLSHMQTLGTSLSTVDISSFMYAPSPAGSDSSLEESSGSTYSSHSRSPSSIGPSSTSMSLPTNSETEEYLRRTLEIPPHLSVDLSALPEPTEKTSKQPPITHMIKLAIWGSRHKRLTLRQIYDEVEGRYPALKSLQDKPWQRSIRHNLSLKAIFVRVERPTSDPGKGHYWALDIRQGEGNKRDRKRKDTRAASRSEDDDEFSEELDEDRSSFVVMGGRHGERRGHHALRIPQESQYPAGPSTHGSSSLLQQGSHGRNPPYPPPMIQGSSQSIPFHTMPLNVLVPTPMMPMMGMQGYSLPANIEHGQLRRHISDPMPARSMQMPHIMPFLPTQMTLPPLDPHLAAQPDHGMLSLNPSLLHSTTPQATLHPASEEDASSTGASRSRFTQ